MTSQRMHASGQWTGDRVLIIHQFSGMTDDPLDGAAETTWYYGSRYGLYDVLKPCSGIVSLKQW